MLSIMFIIVTFLYSNQINSARRITQHSSISSISKADSISDKKYREINHTEKKENHYVEITKPSPKELKRYQQFKEESTSLKQISSPKKSSITTPPPVPKRPNYTLEDSIYSEINPLHISSSQQKAPFVNMETHPVIRQRSINPIFEPSTNQAALLSDDRLSNIEKAIKKTEEKIAQKEEKIAQKRTINPDRKKISFFRRWSKVKPS